jgi:hypothetical protein
VEGEGSGPRWRGGDVRPQAPLARRDDLIIREVGDEVLVYDLRSHRAHCLNRTAALVWRRCDGQTDLADLAALFGPAASAGPIIVGSALAQLGRAGLLARTTDLPEPKADLSRRRLLRVGVGAAAGGVLLPAVSSIVSPVAAQLSSGCRANSIGCTSNAQCCSGLCSGSLCTCVPNGETCTTGSQCCSGNCNPANNECRS